MYWLTLPLHLNTYGNILQSLYFFHSFNVGSDIRCQISFIDILKEIQSYLLKFINTTINLYTYIKKNLLCDICAQQYFFYFSILSELIFQVILIQPAFKHKQQKLETSTELFVIVKSYDIRFKYLDKCYTSRDVDSSNNYDCQCSIIPRDL